MGRSWTLSYMQVCFGQVQAGPNRADTWHGDVTKYVYLEEYLFHKMIVYGVPLLVSFLCLCQNAEADTLKVETWETWP